MVLIVLFFQLLKLDDNNELPFHAGISVKEVYRFLPILSDTLKFFEKKYNCIQIISVVGQARCGKSFLINHLVGELCFSSPANLGELHIVNQIVSRTPSVTNRQSRTVNHTS